MVSRARDKFLHQHLRNLKSSPGYIICKLLFFDIYICWLLSVEHVILQLQKIWRFDIISDFCLYFHTALHLQQWLLTSCQYCTVIVHVCEALICKMKNYGALIYKKPLSKIMAL